LSATLRSIFLVSRPPTAYLSPLFFFNHPPPTHIYTLSLHDALPISSHYLVRIGVHHHLEQSVRIAQSPGTRNSGYRQFVDLYIRSEEHTSELQSRFDLVCRLLLEKKKKKNIPYTE